MTNPVSSPVYSMTGFASLRVDAGNHSALAMTLKSVNHRFLDLQLRLPHSFDLLENVVRGILKAQIHRGHVEFTLHVDRPAQQQGLAMNGVLLTAYIETFRSVARTHGLKCEPDLNELFRLPGIMNGNTLAAHEEASATESSLPAEVEAALPELLFHFSRSRAEEGARLVDELRNSMRRLNQLVDVATALRQDVRAANFERLQMRIAELLLNASLSQERLLTEAALLADRSDIEEELVRLRTHVAAFMALLEQGGPLGKRLDFLLQELNREANTLLSKTGGASSQNGLRITELGLAMKMEIERAKEQVQNLE